MTVPRAAIYVRVSTTRQAERDLSIPDQIAQCKAYCEARDWEVAQVYCEPGASALDEDRPVFQQMIERAKGVSKPFTHIVVHSLSRFSRDAMHSELYVRKLRKAGVELVSITQAISQDSHGEMLRQIMNVFDEHQSRENAKHVHRAMCENTRQGFWNGSAPPFGYRTQITERRGNKDKKVLVIEEAEAQVVRLIFEMASGTTGRPLGVKAIALWLNERGYLRRGNKFSTGSIHGILTASSYHGQHYFNRRDSRAAVNRPPSQWISLEIPALIDEETFNAVQALLQSRDPRRVAPRIVNGPTFLAGLVKCGYCNAALIQNTGKGGAYRYYCCSRKLKEGPSSCRGYRIRMDRLDNLVVDELSARVLEPIRLGEMLQSYIVQAAERSNKNKDHLSSLKSAHRDAEAGILRLLELVEQGLMHAEDGLFRERLVALKIKRDELLAQVTEVQKRSATAPPTITPDKIVKISQLLQDNLKHGPAEFRQSYARLIIGEVRATDDEICISGSKAVLAKVAENDGPHAPATVLSFVREWRTRQDSNL